jgi:hypothetical protein
MAHPVEYWSDLGPAMYSPFHIGNESTAIHSERQANAVRVGRRGV